MSTRARRASARLVAAVVLAVAAGAWPIARAAEGTLDSEISAGRSQLSKLTGDIQDRERRIDLLRKQAQDVQVELDEIEATLSSARALSQAYGAQIQRLDADVLQRSMELLRTRSRIADVRVRLGEHVCRVYQRGKPAYLDILLGSEDFGATLRRTRYVATVLGAERELMRTLASDESRYLDEIDVLKERRDELEKVRANEALERRRLERLQGERAVAVAGTRKDLVTTEAAVEEMRASARNLDELIRVLEARKAAREKAAERERARAERDAQKPTDGERSTPDVPTREPFMAVQKFEGLHGRLPWPVAGPVIVPFGRSQHPKYGTITYNTGIVISATEGTPVRAVAEGQVEFVDWVHGYGRTVIVSHGDGYYSLYAHASRALVREGDHVSAGTQVALSGSTDSLHGPCVHFELRHGGDTLNPLDWLAQ